MALWKTAIVIKEAIADDDVSTGIEAWRECSQEDMQLLWQAESKGGFFTTSERKWISKYQTADTEA